MATASERGLPVVRLYDTAELGIGSQTWSVDIDSRGVVWIGALGGVVELDGEWNRVIESSSAVNSMLPMADGSVLVGEINKLSRLRRRVDGELELIEIGYASDPSFTFGEVEELLPGPGGVLVVARRALFWLEGDELSELRRLDLDAPPPVAGLVGKELVTWTEEGGFERVAEGALHPFALSSAPGRVVQAMIETADGASLVLFERGQPVLIDGERSRPFSGSAAAWLADRKINGGCTTLEGGLAIATEEGLALVTPAGDLEMILDATAGMPEDQVLDVAAAADGALWLATGTGVARMVTSSAITLIDRRLGLTGSLFDIDRWRGSMYVATTDGLFRLDGETGPAAPLVLRRLDSPGTAATGVDGTGDELLVGTPEGAYTWNGEEFVAIPGTELGSSYAFHASRRDPGRLWITNRHGLLVTDRSAEGWSRARRIDGLPEFIRSILELDDGSLWVGSIFDGAYHLGFDDDGEVEILEQVGEGEVGVALGPDGVLFTAQSLVQKLGESGDLEVIEGLRFDWRLGPFKMAIDSRGAIWLNSDPPAIAFADDDGWRIEQHLLSTIPGRDVQVIETEDDEVVWLGTERGLVRIEVPRLRLGRRAPSPLIRRVAVDGVRLPLDGSALIPPGAARLRIELSSSSHDPGSQYQFLLEPTDQDWSQWRGEPVIEFTSLREEDYLLRVRSRTAAWRVSPEASVAFTIAPAWYRTSLARALLVVVIATLLIGFLRWRTHSLELQAERLAGMVIDRTRELHDTVDQLGLAKVMVETKAEQLEEANRRLEEISNQDSLTGVSNRRHLDTILDEEWRRSCRDGSSLSVALLDLDNFKNLNDSQGHQAGDDCLIAIGLLLRQHLRRAADTVARYGGDEFTFVLPSTEVDGARAFAEGIIEAIREAGLGVESARITASIGVSTLKPEEGRCLDELIELADQALYAAKSSGRDQVVVAAPTIG